jgi:2-isopropylmalate synthase
MEYQIEIFDTTLRDGEQSPGFSMNLKDKLALALQLEKLQVDIIEAGFPVASQGDFEAVQEVANVITKCKVAGLCRANKKDIDRAWDALHLAKMPRLHTFIATSDLHLKYKLKKSRASVIEDVSKSVRYAKSLCRDVEFSAEDASRSDREFLAAVFTEAINSGATVINIPDTVGYSFPDEFGSLVGYLKKNVPGIDKVKVSVHCHNDLGLAVANSLAGVKNGATQVECTINGIGERAGNASLEEIVMALKTRQQTLEYYTGIDTRELFPASRLLADITGINVQPNKAVVGKNAFAHEAGIHQDGVLKNPMTYEIMTPHSVGVSGSSLVIGKHSGRHAINVKLEELGYRFSEDVLNDVYAKVMSISDLKKTVTDEDLINAASEVLMSNKEKNSTQINVT